MQFSRRRFLGVLGSVGLAPRFAVGAPTADGFQILRAEARDVELLGSPGGKTQTWQFTEDKFTLLRARQGEEFKVRIINALDREIWFHWFGIRGPSEMMTVNVQPGEANAVDCVFSPPDAGTFWFGPLTDASRLRDMGLYGMLVVEEKSFEPTLFDVPLVIDDWQLDSDGQIAQGFGNLEAAVGAGRIGNWFTVNGSYRPHFTLPADKPCRLRILNTANTRALNFQLKGADPLLVARDGQPLSPRHTGILDLILAPGQRLDLVLDVGNDTSSIVLDLFEDSVEICYLDRHGPPGTSALAENFALPTNPISTNLDMEKARTVPVVIAGGTKGGLKSAKFNNEVLDIRALLEKGIAWAINAAAGPGSAPIGDFAKGETVILEIDNRTAFEQPLHIHGHVWQLIEAAGSRRENQPWTDTTVVASQQNQKLAFVADNPGLWALQSLVAERVDSGLIASFQVRTGD
jgi:FtsP/CotA-like multicopper oxidase with cupredoxin domain